MADRIFDVNLEIEAPNKQFIDNMLESMPHADRIYNEKITDSEEPQYEVRIRYVENWGNNFGEHYVFEGKWSNEEEWGLDTAFKLFDYDTGKGNVSVMSYQALTKIRELMKMGIHFYFA